jgi:hypothetical protein
MRRDARLLKSKALASLRRCARAFNDFDDDGRVSTVLLHLQHAFEMLLKAALVDKNVPVFDKRRGRSVGFEKCVSLSTEKLRLAEHETGLLRTIDALRDDEQHYLGELSEGLLYLHVRAAVTLFDEILTKHFSERLVDHLPLRVLPISADPPGDIDVLFDEQYKQIRRLLEPGRRQRAEARAQIRALLAMEGHVAKEVLVTESDVNRVERAIKAGKPRAAVFPRLESVAVSIEGTGVAVTVRISKKEGAPVQFVPADDPRDIAAVRDLDLQRKYHFSASELARHVGLTSPRATALRRYLGIDENEDDVHVFAFGPLKIPQYSDNALLKMRTAHEEVDMDEVWRLHRPRRRAS